MLQLSLIHRDHARRVAGERMPSRKQAAARARTRDRSRAKHPWVEIRDDALISVELEYASYQEDHEGYCSEAEIEFHEDVVRTRVSIPRKHLRPPLWADADLLVILSPCWPAVLVGLVAEFAHEVLLTADGKKSLAFERSLCGHGTLCCYTQPSWARPRNEVVQTDDGAEGAPHRSSDARCGAVPAHPGFFSRAGHGVLSVAPVRSGVRLYEQSCDLGLEWQYHRYQREQKQRRSAD